MQIKKYLKEVFITLLVIGCTGIGYAALSTVNSGDTLTSTLWNNLVTLVNQNEANIATNTSKLSSLSNDSGNIGIGIANPTSKLDIAGDININGNPLAKVFYIRSSNASVKCINVNYAPAGYTDSDCIWLLSGYAFYEYKTQDNFSVYSDSSCTTVYTSNGLMETKYMDQTNSTVYIKVPVLNGYYSELFCQKGLKQAVIGY